VRLPIRLRMTAWYVGLLAVLLAVVGAVLVVRLRSGLVGEVDRALRPASDQIALDYGREGTREFADSAGTVLKGERAVAQLLDAGGSVVSTFGDPVGATPMLDRDERAAALRPGHVELTRPLGAGGEAFRLTARPVRRAGRRELIVAGESLAPVTRSVHRLLELLALVLPAALLAAAGGGWWLARRALRPVEEMAAAAAAIGPARLDERIAPPHARDEVAYLAATLNTMLDRIQHGVEEQRRLVADASHELRTPLAAMRAEIDVSLRGDEHTAAGGAILRSAREEVDRMARTVDDLLTLATVDEGLVLQREPVDLAALGAAVLGRLRPVADGRGVVLACDGAPVLVLADPDRLAQAIRNVAENAIAFSPPGGEVTLCTERDGDVALLTLRDEGPGIPVADRERVFARFYRADPSRTRTTGGSGLGLAIARELVEAHGGSARVSGGRRGATVVMELPAAGL
jgi:signal transduction histidine kinase